MTEARWLQVHCTYDPETRGGNSPPDGRKVKAPTIHWVSAAHAVDAEVRIYENLFDKEDPNQTAEGEEFTANLNPNSLEVLTYVPESLLSVMEHAVVEAV